MSQEQYDENCDGCKPAMLDVQTGERLSDDHPAMQALQQVFNKLSKDEKAAFHRVCCLNSRDDRDLAVMGKIQQELRASHLLEQSGSNSN